MIKSFLMKVIIHSIALVFLAALLPPASAAKGPRIAYPAADTRTTAFSLPLVIDLDKSSPAGISLSVNDHPVKIVPRRNAAIATVSLAPGKNVIKLERRGRTLDRKTVTVDRDKKSPGLFRLHPGPSMINKCAACHPNARRGDYRGIGKKSCRNASCHPRIGKNKFRHGPLKKGKCLACHNPHGTSNPAFTAEPRQKLCFSCHSDLEAEFDRKVVHSPVKKGACLACHDPHGSNQRFYLKQKTIRGLCASCHGDRQSQYKNLHEPVAEGDCIACHDPHVADFPFLLTAKGNELCFTCHELRKEEFNRMYVHQPLRRGCVICHDPHGSSAPDHLNTGKNGSGGKMSDDKQILTFCLTCHQKLNPEISRAIRTAKVKHQPVAEGKCLACHTPHSTNFPKQLKDLPADLCFSCHKKMAKKIKTAKYRHGPVRRGNCAQCHQVHGGSRKYLLAAEFSTDFYSNFNPEKYALCFSCHNQKVYTETNNTETGFRNGNLSLHAVHVKAGGRGCRGCHDIHASNQPRHIREESVFKGKDKIRIKFTPTKTGGTCVVGCHRPERYDRINPVTYQTVKK